MLPKAIRFTTDVGHARWPDLIPIRRNLEWSHWNRQYALRSLNVYRFRKWTISIFLELVLLFVYPYILQASPHLQVETALVAPSCLLWIFLKCGKVSQSTSSVMHQYHLAGSHFRCVTGTVEEVEPHSVVTETFRWLITTASFLPGDVKGYKGRNNSNNFDLNRNFPDQFVTITEPRQPETIAVMSWLKSTPFILSANLHGGMVLFWALSVKDSNLSVSQTTFDRNSLLIIFTFLNVVHVFF